MTVPAEQLETAIRAECPTFATVVMLMKDATGHVCGYGVMDPTAPGCPTAVTSVSSPEGAGFLSPVPRRKAD